MVSDLNNVVRADDAARSGGLRIVFRDLGIGFGGYQAVSGINLEIEDSEFVCLLGPSGCGKSTLLMALAGFVAPNRGSIRLGDSEVTGPNPECGVVFQGTEALFDWLTVRRNVAFGPRMRGVPRARQREIVDEFLGLVGLRHTADHFPNQLSGGMRQRVQLARVLANQPRVVLMDEPFGALDAQTREVMQGELDRIWQTHRSTVVFVTHDIDEAILLADRVVVMSAGPEARIKSSYRVELPRPRQEDSAAFTDLRRRLRQDIGDEVRASLRVQGADIEGAAA
ncbi:MULTISPECIES: ABC transporter ATP-binding protein [unclassified Pseudofrankia]|uniref:ABC transporter ATP-binding protein n=1 Tax=unclassified Pseudofrankia TaxID=2994372 RepID=UPI0008D967D3|nr:MULTISPECIES: ABC transporter ATP-binding protein [unclassified Pseudofrankia]MDT3441959.1 ABC transporter ATP-binding protein [Pseudofrankia sp. BMG5.37]OHV44593.1 nitrate ABC transporter ATP-binding protein [Pseudofrankia sp. BMG5.36]